MTDNSFPALEDIHTIVFDFDGVFTDNKVYVDQNGFEMVCCDRRDGLAIDFLRKFQREGRIKAEAFILSTETNPIVEARARKLKLTCYTGVHNKLNWLENYLAQRIPFDASPFSGLIYLGNDLNDLPVINVAGFSAVPSDAHPMVKSVASFVCPERGGAGFVRAFIENFLTINL